MSEPTFPPRGLSWFWFLNDACESAHVDRQVAEFARAGCGAVCLHPRPGLLLPYGGDDWFAFIRRTARQCAAWGLEVWLYDEDPYPSGNAGGRILLDHPEHEARQIAMFEAPPGLKPGGLFCFPTGRLLWAGLVGGGAAFSPATDLTSRVGLVRREWEVRKGWDSRWYYPATPLYVCDRAWTYKPEFALQAPEVPDGMKLVAFVSVPSGRDSDWGGLVDSLNPAATRLFIELTHERYREAVGEMFGREITAIFSDEPKYFGERPWTPDLFASFAARFGYDLGPHLADLFSDEMSERAMLTRLHYREWCGQRFREAWLSPVADWCHAHGLKLVGHISPEDDPVQQVACVSNLFPLLPCFDLPGLDLIIPAAGDRAHPLINIGVVSAASVAQQRGKPGVLSEMLACSGLDFTARAAMRIVNWQTVMGVTTPVVHGAYSSVEGNRLIDAPPDFGPFSSRWTDMNQLSRHLPAVQEMIIGATQVAPVAILWPIRSFEAELCGWQAEPGSLRGALADLLLACLEHQVGVHLLDEETLWEATLADRTLAIGRTAYSTVVIPSCRILHRRTFSDLLAAAAAGVQVCLADEAPPLQQTEAGIERAPGLPFPRVDIDRLPRVAQVSGPGSENVRASAWTKDSLTRLLLINIGRANCVVAVNGCVMRLPAGEIVEHTSI